MKTTKALIFLALAVNLTVAAQQFQPIVNVIPLSQGPNAYAMSNNITRLWANDDLSTVTFLHRVYPPLGTTYLAYDLSVTRGETWTLNIPVYDPGPGGLTAYFAQGGIFNPKGNTNPELAYFTWFALASGGQYLSGIHKLDQSGNPKTNVWNSASCSGPLAFTINPDNGDVFAVAPTVVGGTGNYDDNLALSRGVFNPATEDYEFSQQLLPLPAQPGGYPIPVDMKIAFAPDGLTGYISMLFDNLLDPFAAGGGLYPVLLKTTDGGVTWGGPSAVVLGGPAGLPEIKSYINNDMLQTLFMEFGGIHRDSVVYQTAYDHGLGVDLYGNPHICVTIGVSGVHFDQPYAINASFGYGATFHIFSLDQGSTWIGRYITHNKTFRGCAGALCWDNRSQVSATADGGMLFFSWLDSDFEGVDENTMPDIWCQGYKIESQHFSEIHNVTFLSEIWMEAYMAIGSPYVFTGLQWGWASYLNIPFVSHTIPGFNPALPVGYRYVSDFKIPENGYFIIGNMERIIPASNMQLVSCFPNPATDHTILLMNLSEPAALQIELFNVSGQKVHAQTTGKLQPGKHQLKIDLQGLSAGFYLYTVSAGQQKVNGKLMIR